ncbi:MAG TPA: DUF1326 domain-containing protein [Planctomycetaceae bacterium]|nr:DUF1326 domain-containing protein [Planctomycetaceae bacterium]
MRTCQAFAVLAALTVTAAQVDAATIKGQYLEARTCSVYTGPCFGNAEIGLAGKEAVLAWKVEQGTWKDVSLDGLGVALVLSAEGTLGFDEVFDMDAGRIESVILVDENASREQQRALVDFVKDSARRLTGNVQKVQSVPFKLENDHLEGQGVFSAGDLAKIETRALQKGDCVCSNEIIFYLPLTDVDNYSPAFSKTSSFQGDGLDKRWTGGGERGAFLATFRK